MMVAIDPRLFNPPLQAFLDATVNVTIPLEGEAQETAQDAPTIRNWRPSWDNPLIFGQAGGPSIPAAAQSALAIADVAVTEPVTAEQVAVWRILGIASFDGSMPNFSIKRRRGLLFSRLSKAWITRRDLERLRIRGNADAGTGLNPEMQFIFSPNDTPNRYSIFEPSIINFDLQA